jgi:hypothetical protein
VFFLFFSGLFGVAPLAASAQAGLVISQMYGGGGNSGAQYTYDYLELYNPTSSAINLNGLSYQYASSAGTSWNSVILPNATVAPGHYFLIQGAAGTGTPGNLPVTPDFVVAPDRTSPRRPEKLRLFKGRPRSPAPAQLRMSLISWATEQRIATRVPAMLLRRAIRLPISAADLAATTPRISRWDRPIHATRRMEAAHPASAPAALRHRRR